MEKMGLIHGYILGIFTGLISFLRSSRMFHPRGIVFGAEVDSKVLPNKALVRFSSGWWKKKEWPDALGISIRFHQDQKEQDLLFASFSSPLLLLISPFITNFKDYFGNTYYGVGFFQRGGRIVKYKINPKRADKTHGSRKQKLEHDYLQGASLELIEEDQETKGTQVIAILRLVERPEVDQEALRFSAFKNDFNIVPRGYLQYLRVGTYKLGQLSRPKSKKS